MGCKYNVLREISKKPMRINSYIVGCKYGKDYSADEHTPELIVT